MEGLIIIICSYVFLFGMPGLGEIKDYLKDIRKELQSINSELKKLNKK